MKKLKDKDIHQEDLVLVQEEKMDPVKRFFQELMDEIEEIQIKSDEFFLKLKKDFDQRRKKIRASWKEIREKIDPSYRRHKSYMQKFEEIKDDTEEIRLKLPEFERMIDKLMEQHKDIEKHMKWLKMKRFTNK